MTQEPDFTAEDISGMLKVIPTRPDYGTWLHIASAVWSVLPMTEGCRLLNQWSPEERDGEYAGKHKARLEKITVGTLVYLARANGWRDPRHDARILFDRPRSPRSPRAGWRMTFDPMSAVETPPAPAPTKQDEPSTALSELRAMLAKSPADPLPTYDATGPSGPSVPAGYCETCWRKWARALRPGACICTGHVQRKKAA